MRNKAQESARKLWEVYLTVLCIMFFEFYPGLASKAAKMVSCTTVDFGNGTTSRVLIEDARIDCESEVCAHRGGNSGAAKWRGTPPWGAKKAPLWRGICAETPGAPLRAPQKGSKKGQKKIPRCLDFGARGAPSGRPSGAASGAEPPPPQGLKNAPMPRRRASLIATPGPLEEIRVVFGVPLFLSIWA